MCATGSAPSPTGAPGVQGTAGGTDDPALRVKRHAENFPVALRALPRRERCDLIAVYDVARVIDDLGDEADGDRTTRLTEFGGDLAGIWEGRQPRHPVLRRLVPTVAERGLPREPFQRLLRANLVDQRVHRYRSYAELRGYCELSAHPVGRIVLGVFQVTDPALGELSDRVCAALQLLEHWQDVGEDRRAGRVYLPADEMARFGVTEADLDAAPAGPRLRRLMVFQTERAARLLDSGAGLVGELHGWARLAVAGYVAGGMAAVDGLRRTEGDVLGRLAGTRRRDVARHAVALLARAALGQGGRRGRRGEEVP